MKGPKNKIKTTINPIRTLTPRFIQKILDKLELIDNKTKNLNSLLSTFNLNSKVLIVTDQISDNLHLASRNLREVHVLSHRSLNVYEIMKNNKVVFTKKAIESFIERFRK